MSETHTLTIRPLAAGDASAYQALRLRALRDHPDAFGASVEDEADRTIEQVERQLDSKTGDDFILGAFAGPELAGVVGFGRREGGKRQHRGFIWGMYVAPEHRGAGLGGALLDEAIRRGRSLDGLEMILLAVAVGNDTARRLYASAGFEPHYVDWHMLKLGDRYIDMEWMRLVIS